MKIDKHKSIKLITLCDLYVFFFVMYKYANMYIHTSMAVLGAYIPMLLICLCGIYLAIIKYKANGYIKTLIVFLSFLSVYGMIRWFGGGSFGDTKSNSFLFRNVTSLAPILVFYIGARKGVVSENRMHFYFLVLLVLTIVEYFHSFAIRDLTIEGSVTSEGATNNIAYYFVCMLPLVFLFDKKPIFQYVTLLILLFFIMSGMKRGAIVVAVFFIILFIRFSLKKNNSKINYRNTIFSIILILAFVYLLYYFAQRVWLNNDFFYARLQRVQKGDSSGRDVILQNLLHHYSTNENFFQMIFGLGADGTIRVGGLYAHNDWVEMLIDCGFVGLLVYLAYFYSLYKDCRRYREIKPEAYLIISCFVILFVRSFFSMSFMDMHLGISSALGYGMAVCEQKYNDGLI